MHPKPITPKHGQESAWDYPRPPRLERVTQSLEVYLNGVCIASTSNGYRVLETSHPPVYYFPPADLRMEFFKSAPHRTHCEWKGMGSYYDIEVDGLLAQNAAWYYDQPYPAFQAIKNYPAFYGHKMDRCLVGGVQAEPQPGNFYGGWITPDIVGPFKGIPGSMGW